MKSKTTTKKPDIKVFTDKQLIKELERRDYNVSSLTTHKVIGKHLVEKDEIENLYDRYYDDSWSDDIKNEYEENFYTWVEDFYISGGGKYEELETYLEGCVDYLER